MKHFNSPALYRRHFILLLAALTVSTAVAWADGTNTDATATVVKTNHVACVGDSITFGAGITDRKHDAYPVVLGGMLGDGWDVRNYGSSGTTVVHKGNRPYYTQKAHNSAVAASPDIVVIMLGTNDSKHPGDGSNDSADAVDNLQYKADFVTDYEALIAEFRKANPAAKIFLCLPTPCFPGFGGINGKTIHDEIIPLVRQVAKDENLPIIDLNTPFADKKEMFVDTVHPNVAGAKIIAQTVYQALTGKPAPAAAQ